TRKGPRIEVLLLLSALSAFATWLVGMACESSGIDQWLAPFRSKRRLYSVMRLGREALVRRWLNVPLSQLIEKIRHPAPTLLDQQ
ncbi:MAG: IS4 family transposase, partial [Oleiagrimonas sp.]|nr:IS4 family transposase [Oleiagrimonas sp.]